MPQFRRWDEDPVERERNPTATSSYAPPFEGMLPAPTQGEDFGSFETPSYGGYSSPQYSFGQVPMFDAPDFNAPSYEDAQNEPGFQFRLGQGTDALERSAAARGVLRTGGTLKDLLEYGQNFGAQEYANVYNRAMQAYQAKYQAAKDEYAPGFAQWQAQFGAEQARAMAEFQRQMELYDVANQNNRFKEGLIFGTLNQPEPSLGG